MFSLWRKDLKRRHTLVRSYDTKNANPEAQRLHKVCKAFYEVAYVGINSDDDVKKVMKSIDNLKVELKCEGASPASQDISNISKISHEQIKILDSLVVCGKGRPPSKRKESTVDQIVKKLRKKKQESSQKRKSCGRKEKVMPKCQSYYTK